VQHARALLDLTSLKEEQTAQPLLLEAAEDLE